MKDLKDLYDVIYARTGCLPETIPMSRTWDGTGPIRMAGSILGEDGHENQGILVHMDEPLGEDEDGMMEWGSTTLVLFQWEGESLLEWTERAQVFNRALHYHSPPRGPYVL